MIDRLSVVIPAYNEEEGIRESIEGVCGVLDGLGIEHELIVIDDGSTDGTAQALASMPAAHIVRNATNLGYGAAIKRGVERASYEYVLIADADATYPASCVAALVARMDDCDMTVGARRLATIKIPLSWKISKVAVQAFLYLFLGKRVPDLNSGARIFKKELALELAPILSDAFSYSSGMTVAALKAGRRVCFTPIEYRPRKGRSKVRPVSYTLSFVRSVTRALAYRPRAKPDCLAPASPLGSDRRGVE